MVCACLQVLHVVPFLVRGTSGVGHTTELYNSPYSLSEDFVSSYRMHPLIPDVFHIDGQQVRQPACTLPGSVWVAPCMALENLLSVQHIPRHWKSVQSPQPASIACHTHAIQWLCVSVIIVFMSAGLDIYWFNPMLQIACFHCYTNQYWAVVGA